jgi:hypothetical protein
MVGCRVGVLLRTDWGLGRVARDSSWVECVAHSCSVAALCLHPTVFHEAPSGAYLHTPVSSSSTVSTPAPAVNQISQTLSHLLVQIGTSPNMSVVSLVSERTISPLPGTCAYSGDFDFLRRSFLQMLPSDLRVKYGIPMVFS